MSLLRLPTLEEVIRPRYGARPRTIGVLSLDPGSYGKAALLAGVQQATRQTDSCMSMLSLEAPSATALADAVERLGGLTVDGILVLAPQGAAVDALAGVSSEIPLVVVGAGRQDVLSSVTTDHYAGAAAATRHLLELGHASVFHIAGPADGGGAGSSYAEPGSRLAGWRDALRAAGAPVPGAMIGDGTPEGGYRLGRRLASQDEVTAIFVASDQMALGVLHALCEARRRVPEDVSIVGFGDMPEGEFFNPPLSTVRQNFIEMGRRGAELLQTEIESPGGDMVHETIAAHLILRASTAAA